MAYDYRNHANFLFEFITSTLDHSICWNVSSCSRKPVSTSENDLGLWCRVSGGAALLSTSHSDVTSRQEVRLAVVVGLPGSVLLGRLRNFFNTSFPNYENLNNTSQSTNQQARSILHITVQSILRRSILQQFSARRLWNILDSISKDHPYKSINGLWFQKANIMNSSLLVDY